MLREFSQCRLWGLWEVDRWLVYSAISEKSPGPAAQRAGSGGPRVLDSQDPCATVTNHP